DDRAAAATTADAAREGFGRLAGAGRDRRRRHAGGGAGRTVPGGFLEPVGPRSDADDRREVVGGAERSGDHAGFGATVRLAAGRTGTASRERPGWSSDP